MEEKKELFATRMLTGKRSYFFDVYEAKTGNKYILISESKKVDEGFEHQRIIVFEDALDSFKKSFLDAVKFVEEGANSSGLSDQVRQ